MKSSILTPGASPSVASPTRSFNVLLADGSRLRVTCRDLAAQLRQERNATLKRLRQARAEALADVADRISEARIRREFEARERDTDAAIRRLSKSVRVRPEPRRRSSTPRPLRSSPTGTGHARVVVTQRTASALARRDWLGREGIMLRIRYVRAGGKHASPGCLRRHYRYIAREAAVTLDSDGEPIVLGNMGVTAEDVAGALDLQEQVLRGMRKNAKLGFRMIGAFPYGLPVDARREMLQRIGDEVFGARGLPWTAAAHDADPGAKVDNPHFHLDYSTLPMVRQADGSFVISNDLRTDLDGQEGLRFIRHSVARVMTEVARDHGLDRTFTALSYRERGMDREGGEHVGQEGTAAHRRGEHVAAIARNEARQRLGEARQKLKRARERVGALERLKRAISAISAAPSVWDQPSSLGAAAVAVLEPAPAATGPLGISELSGAAPIAEIIPVIDAVSVVRATQSEWTPAAVMGSLAPDRIPSPAPSQDMPPTVFTPDPAPLATTPEYGMTVILARAPTTGTSPPVVRDIDAAPDRAAAPAVVSDGPTAPIADTVPVLIATRYTPPSVTVVELPHVISPAAAVTNAIPVMTRIGQLISGAAPSGVVPLGPPIDRSTMTAPILWAVGKKASLDPADTLAEQHLADAIARAKERRHIAQVGAAQGNRLDPALASSVKDARRRALEDMLAAIAEERHFLRRANGVVVVEPHLLARFGLSQSDAAEPAMVRRLSDLADKQTAEVSQIASHVRTSPQDIVPDGDGWRLDDAAPVDIRRLVAAWRNDETMQQALGRVIVARPAAELVQDIGQSGSEPVGTAWRRARLARERAMALGDALDRRDGNGLPQPGRRILRPGVEQIDNAPFIAGRLSGRGV